MGKNIVEGRPKTALRKLEELFLVFLLTSVAGWIYEVVLEVVVYRWGYSDRGVLIGPYCPVYGIGALILLLCLRKLVKKRIAIGPVSVTPVLVFACIVLITTLVELAASYIMEWATGTWMWDYTQFHPNFQGRVALDPSLRFGVGGMAFLYFLYPLYQRTIANVSSRNLTVITAGLAYVFFMDCLLSVLPCG